tara:strand:- start:26 stop:1543 length:1518 start_codon:yes stop_codon:yes gene_type:complete
MTIISGDYNAYSNLKKQKEQEFKFLSTQDNSLLNGINTKINTIQNSSDDDWFANIGNETSQTFQMMSSILKEDPNNIDALKEFMDKGGMDSSKLRITDDAEINNQLAMQEFAKMTKGQNLQFLYEYQGRIEKKKLLHADAARSWGFGFYGLDPSPNDLSSINKSDKQISSGKTFMDNFKKGIIPPETEITLPELKKYNFNNSIIKTEDKKEDMPLNAGTTSIITSVMKKYEGINQETNPDLVNANNLYAIKFGNRAESYGAKDSGVQASDGGTFASFDSLESADKAAAKIVADMLDKDAEGDLKKFIGNYIGATPENPKTNEINTRYNEIVQLSTQMPNVKVKPLQSDEIRPAALNMANKMFLNWQDDTKKSNNNLKDKINDLEKKVSQIKKNKPKEGSISKKQKESNKKRLKFEKQIKELKIKLNSQTNKLKQTKSLDNWYNNFATSVEIDKIIKSGAGNPKSEVEENAFIKGIADTKGIPNLEEGIFEQLYNELRPGSALMNK